LDYKLNRNRLPERFRIASPNPITDRRRSYNLSSEDYRKKWGLPEDFPMAAPKYSKRRSELAKKSGKRPRARKQAVS
jgi:hypothetical protein